LRIIWVNIEIKARCVKIIINELGLGF